MMNKTTVYVVIRTLTVEAVAAVPNVMVDAMPIVEGVFTSYEAANDFVDPLLDNKGDCIEYSIIERELQ